MGIHDDLRLLSIDDAVSTIHNRMHVFNIRRKTVSSRGKSESWANTPNLTRLKRRKSALKSWQYDWGFSVVSTNDRELKQMQPSRFSHKRALTINLVHFEGPIAPIPTPTSGINSC